MVVEGKMPYVPVRNRTQAFSSWPVTSFKGDLTAHGERFMLIREETILTGSFICLIHH